MKNVRRDKVKKHPYYDEALKSVSYVKSDGRYCCLSCGRPCKDIESLAQHLEKHQGINALDYKEKSEYQKRKESSNYGSVAATVKIVYQSEKNKKEKKINGQQQKYLLEKNKKERNVIVLDDDLQKKYQEEGYLLQSIV